MRDNPIEQFDDLRSSRRAFQEYSEAFVVAVILAIVIRALLFQAFKIPSSSMESTLLVGDHILVNKLLYGLRVPFTDIRWPKFTEPKTGDVVVFIFPEDRTKDFIKRVIGTPGDTVEIKDKAVFLNGKELSCPYAEFRSKDTYSGEVSRRDNLKAFKVPRGKLFVMGDNRDFSHDSRFWGFVPEEDVKGKAFIIYYSTPAFSAVRWDRLCKLIR